MAKLQAARAATLEALGRLLNGYFPWLLLMPSLSLSLLYATPWMQGAPELMLLAPLHVFLLISVFVVTLAMFFVRASLSKRFLACGAAGIFFCLMTYMLFHYLAIFSSSILGDRIALLSLLGGMASCIGGLLAQRTLFRVSKKRLA